MGNEMSKVTVIGAGAMGTGIAKVTAQAGYKVTLVDISEEILNKARENMKSSLERLAKKGKISEKATATSSWQPFSWTYATAFTARFG